MRLAHSKFQLEGYYVKSLQYSVRPGLEDSSRLALTSGLHVQPFKPMQGHMLTPECIVEASQHVKDDTRFRVALTVRSSPKDDDPPPYIFEVTLIGYFNLAGLTPTQEVRTFALGNAATILYSSARELIAAVTGRGPFPALVLPTVNFLAQNPNEEAASTTKRHITKGAAKRRIATKVRTARKK